MTSRHESWTLIEEVGGEARLTEIVADFYDRVFDDPLIGFLFQGHDKDRLVAKQVEYLRARLGDEEIEYTGKPIRDAHRELPITVGHFDRRHALLEDVLEDWEMPGWVRDEWLELDAALRDLVVRTGEEARDEYIGD
ncbi:MAG: truncated hemoglobin [Bradymonadaceae bacterium]